MRYFIRTVIGLGLMVLGAMLMAYALYQLLQIGTCASGGPYVSARECPAGTERLALAFFPAIIGLMAGAVLYGGRGTPPGSEGGGFRVNAWILLWALIFLPLSFAAFWGVWGPDANPGPGGKEGGLIVAFLFALMGLAALPFLVRRPSTPADRQVAMERVVGRMTPSSWQSQVSRPGGDTVAKLERLSKLRADGAITEAEFEQLKADILAGRG